mmetsp:Transcript_2170/g.8551  ORF Transcript_2170/g.8551 Transcript_2170/m.8551 type:complete len:202 (+) Transcript_2170:4882-5487(+)
MAQRHVHAVRGVHRQLGEHLPRHLLGLRGRRRGLGTRVRVPLLGAVLLLLLLHLRQLRVGEPVREHHPGQVHRGDHLGDGREHGYGGGGADRAHAQRVPLDDDAENKGVPDAHGALTKEGFLRSRKSVRVVFARLGRRRADARGGGGDVDRAQVHAAHDDGRVQGGDVVREYSSREARGETKRDAKPLAGVLGCGRGRGRG